MRFNDVPRLGIGTWMMGDDVSKRDDEIAAIRSGLDAGLRLIDTAEMYGDGRSEELVGEAIAGRRDEVFLVSKVLPENSSHDGVRRSLRASLERLGTDYLDCYLLHWRGAVPLAETVAAFDEAVSEGLIRSWGVSNFDPDDLHELQSISGDCATNQVLYNLTRRGPEVDLFPLMRMLGMPAMAYSPIEQGRLFEGEHGKRLAAIASEAGLSPAVLALAWVMRDGSTIAIPKTSSLERMQENVSALDLELTDGVLAALEDAFPAPERSGPLETI